MHKKIGLFIGLVVLGFLTVAVWLRPEHLATTPPAGAAQLRSSFGPANNISNSAGGGYTSQRVRTDIGSDNILHPVWMEGIVNVDNSPAYAGGQESAWNPWVWIAPNDRNNRGYTNPTVALDSQNNVHATWAGNNGPPYRIFYAYKPVGGSWSTPTNLSEGLPNSVYASIALDSQDRVWIVWETELGEGQFDVYARTKPAGGSWSPAVSISNQSGMELEPDVIVDASDVPHVVWRYSAGWEIYHTKYVNGSWTTPFNVSANASASHFARIDADSQGNVFVVWEDEIDGSDRFQTLFRRWDGSQWGAVRRASETPSKALYPSIAADNCNLYAVWTDYRSKSTETFFSYSFDCGTTWSTDENVSSNSSASFHPAVAAQPGGFAHIFWQDYAPGDFDIYYRKGTVELPVPPTTTPSPKPSDTPTPIVTATPTHTPRPTPTPTPEAPWGDVSIVANQPTGNTNYTQQLNVSLHFSATFPVGSNPQMRYSNQGDFAGASWVPYTPAVPSWNLDPGGTYCSYKWVFAQFKDQYAGGSSPPYADYILFDNTLTATMSLNGGGDYTNRTLVMVNSVDSDGAMGCSGLEDISLWEEGLAQTIWISYYPQLYFFLAPRDPLTGTTTVYASYRDRTGNSGTFQDSITFDPDPPYDGSPPTLNYGSSPTNHLLIPVTDVEATDDGSGVANIWLANQEEGPWKAIPYQDPPHEYTWNLAYGGPPLVSPDLHYVYLRYEDGSGYGAFPGNLSETFSASITVLNISNVYLPIVSKEYHRTGIVSLADTPSSREVELILLSELLPNQEGQEGQDVLLWLAARPVQEPSLEATMRLVLPSGLEVVRAWSAYGQLLRSDEHVVVSQEKISAQQVPWVLVHAHAAEETRTPMEIRGEMYWDDTLKSAASLQIDTR